MWSMRALYQLRRWMWRKLTPTTLRIDQRNIGIDLGLDAEYRMLVDIKTCAVWKITPVLEYEVEVHVE